MNIDEFLSLVDEELHAIAQDSLEEADRIDRLYNSKENLATEKLIERLHYNGSLIEFTRRMVMIRLDNRMRNNMARVKNLHEYTDLELKEEMERRVREKNKMPVPLDGSDFREVALLLTEEVQFLAREKCNSKGIERHVFEAVMEAVFGKKIWEWWNEGYKHCKG